jgi:hypothetical protein
MREEERKARREARKEAQEASDKDNLIEWLGVKTYKFTEADVSRFRYLIDINYTKSGPECIFGSEADEEMQSLVKKYIKYPFDLNRATWFSEVIEKFANEVQRFLSQEPDFILTDDKIEDIFNSVREIILDPDWVFYDTYNSVHWLIDDINREKYVNKIINSGGYNNLNKLLKLAQRIELEEVCGLAEDFIKSYIRQFVEKQY